MFRNSKIIKEMNKRGIPYVDAKNNTIEYLIKLGDIRLITQYIRSNRNLSINDLVKLVDAVLAINEINNVLIEDLLECSRAIDYLIYRRNEREVHIISKLSSSVYDLVVKKEIKNIIEKNDGTAIITYAFDITRKMYISEENKEKYINILANALIDLGNIDEILWFAYGVLYAPKKQLFISARNLGYTGDFYEGCTVNIWEDYPTGKTKEYPDEITIFDRVEIHVNNPMSKAKEKEFLYGELKGLEKGGKDKTK